MGLPEDAVDAINDASGSFDGYRAAHAKGTLCEGVFTAAADTAYTKVALTSISRESVYFFLSHTSLKRSAS